MGPHGEISEMLLKPTPAALAFVVRLNHPSAQWEQQKDLLLSSHTKLSRLIMKTQFFTLLAMAAAVLAASRELYPSRGEPT